MTHRTDGFRSIDALSRRGVMRGAAVGGLTVPLLAACGGEDDAANPTATPDGSTSAGGAEVTLAAADVPIGGGTILAEDRVVITQPTEGDFRAFTAICPHQSCVVSAVTDGEIQCVCHGSAFSIEDGSVVNGPATAGLAETPVKADGSDLFVG